ncbi:hypothetical protein HY967_03430 [Candidatus Jorgensenbacteria bacterium]|nr:hypothetical protein [Candidatus Jorgensenbacteria bacterium]
MIEKRGKFILFEGISGSGKSTLAELLYDWFLAKGIPVILNAEPTKSNIFGKTARDLVENHIPSREKIERDLEIAVKLFSAEIGGVQGAAERPRQGTMKFCRVLKGALEKMKIGQPLLEIDIQSFFIADRYYDLKDTIRPMLKKGTWLIQDRFDWSTLSYWAAHGLSTEEAYEWQSYALAQLYLRPHLTFYVDTDPEIAMKRLRSSRKVLDRYETLASLRSIATEYGRVIPFMHSQAMRQSITESEEKFDPRITVIDGEKDIDEVFEDITRTVERGLIHPPHTSDE